MSDMKFTHEEMERLRHEASTGMGIDNGHASIVILDAFDLIETLRRRNKKLERLYKALKVVVDDEEYEAGYVSHHGDCNKNHAWGAGPHKCDCYVGEVHKALEALSGTVLDDLVNED